MAASVWNRFSVKKPTTIVEADEGARSSYTSVVTDKIHNPLPLSMKSECEKCGKILADFIDLEKQADQGVIIPAVLRRAKGLAIISVFRLGFFYGSARYGNGVLIARLPDGTWSAPSAVGLLGVGGGMQIGVELTDFVFILNDSAAVRTFSQAGSLALSGNVSMAAGPVGRNAEAMGAASLKGVAGVHSFGKTRGLFAGVSLEGSVLFERRRANKKIYGRKIKAAQLLQSSIRPPKEAELLLSILNPLGFNGIYGSDDRIYNDSVVIGNERRDEAESQDVI